MEDILAPVSALCIPACCVMQGIIVSCSARLSHKYLFGYFWSDPLSSLVEQRMDLAVPPGSESHIVVPVSECWNSDRNIFIENRSPMFVFFLLDLRGQPLPLASSISSFTYCRFSIRIDMSCISRKSVSAL